MSGTKAAQLLPCPFCGAEAEVMKHGVVARNLAVHCTNNRCNAGPMVTGSTRARAIAEWNTRNGVPATEMG